MIANMFKSTGGYTVTTSKGSKISFSVGNTQEVKDGPWEQSCFFDITDINGNEVAKFGLSAESFGGLMEVIKSTFDEFIPEPVD